MALTVYAYTAAMRAATEGGRWHKVLENWQDMGSDGVEPSGVGSSSGLLQLISIRNVSVGASKMHSLSLTSNLQRAHLLAHFLVLSLLKMHKLQNVLVHLVIPQDISLDRNNAQHSA